MSRVRSLVEGLRDRTDLTIEDQKDAWLVRIPKGKTHVCEITIPHGVFEWFASVKSLDDQKEVWHDWMDHYDASDTELDAEMADCISAFIKRVAGSDLRLPLKIYEED